VGDVRAAEENWRFDGPFKRMTFASRMQHAIYWGPLRWPVEWSLRTWLAPWSYVASVAYHDAFWYPLHARKRMREAMESEWGRLFLDWEDAALTADGRGYERPACGAEDGRPKEARRAAALRLPSVGQRLGLIAMAVKDSPEMRLRKH
jgi:hypothetical protein